MAQRCPPFLFDLHLTLRKQIFTCVKPSSSRPPARRSARPIAARSTTPRARQLGGHAIAQAVARAGIDPAEIDDVVMGAALQQGSTGNNIARQAALARRPAQHRLGHDARPPVRVGPDGHRHGGQVHHQRRRQMSRSAAVWRASAWSRTSKMNRYRHVGRVAAEHVPDIYTSMLETAEIVAERYGISREAQDEYALQSQQRTAAAQAAGRFDAEIVPDDHDHAGAGQGDRRDRRQGSHPRPRTRATARTTTLADLQKLKPVFKGGRDVKEGKFVTAGNASPAVGRRSAAVVLMEAQGSREARPDSRWAPIAAWPWPAAGRRRWASARCSPIPKLLERNGLTDRRHRHLGAERGLRLAGASTAATSSASTRPSTTSRAAPSRSATPTA